DLAESEAHYGYRNRKATNMRHIRKFRLPALVAALALTIAACGGGGGDEAASDELSGATFTVGSKEFTEQLVLGQIAIQALENAGASVNDETGIQGTTNTRKALTSGKIDMYWEYTGTGWTTLLQHEATDAPKDPQKLFDQVAKEDLDKNNVKWTALSEVNNTYALATAKSTAEDLGVENISDYAELANSSPDDATICAASEFLDRADAWPGLQDDYDFKLPGKYVTEVELGIIYTRVPKQDPCKFGEVFGTDGRIPANDMVVLDDDKNFFVKYNLAMTIDNDVFEKYDALEDIFGDIADKLDTETMQDLNSQVDVDGLPPEAVAQKRLEDNKLIG